LGSIGEGNNFAVISNNDVISIKSIYGKTIERDSISNSDMFSCTHCGFLTSYEIDLQNHMNDFHLNNCETDKNNMFSRKNKSKKLTGLSEQENILQNYQAQPKHNKPRSQPNLSVKPKNKVKIKSKSPLKKVKQPKIIKLKPEKAPVTVKKMSVELQTMKSFISLDKKFDRASMLIKEGEGEKIAETVQNFIKSLNPTKEPKAIFHKNYVRKGTIFNEGEVGILLDNTAIDILVNETLNMLQELVIKQAKGYMCVDTLEVDYNDSHKMMRIKRHPDQANPEPQTDYAVYFEVQ